MDSSWEAWPQEVANKLGGDGPVAQSIDGFSPRSVQQEMAQYIANAMEQNRTLIAEAGTGTGKTFAYLVPALLSGKQVVVSTGTKALQDQLYFNDLPQLQQALGSQTKVSLLKGRSNYLCLYRLDQVIHERDLMETPEQGEQLEAIRAWAARTERGDRVEMTTVPETAPIWSRVTSTPENCLGSKCPFYQQCYVYKARREAADADLIVVNHHLLLADLALKREGVGQLLPDVDTFIIDEAHQLPGLTGQFFSKQVSTRQFTDLTRDTLTECRQASGAMDLLGQPVRQVNDAVRQCRAEMQGLAEKGTLAQLFARSSVKTAWDHLLHALQLLVEVLDSQAERSRGMGHVHKRGEQMNTLLKQFDTSDEETRVDWYALSKHGFTLHATPLDLAGPLSEIRQSSEANWIFTSATLSVAGKFTHFARQLGLDEPDTVSFESPFDYPQQAMTYLPVGLPMPDSKHYTAQVIEAVLPVLEASNGRAFLLFTSHRALKQAAQLLANKPWPLFIQGDTSNHQLLRHFRASGNGVLLGAASFWEGVDMAGEALSVVVIDKLPFAAPDDPVLQARLAAIKAAGENPFMSWQIPAAVIALKQGTGRLIRHVSDRGVLVLCDPRLTSKGYGKLFLRSLPDMPRTQDEEDVVAFFDADSAIITP